MDILAIIAGVLKIADAITRLAANKQLLDAGSAQGILQHNAKTMEMINEARRGRAAMADGSDPTWSQRMRDKYTRRDG